jgi:hypothetical protein
VLYGIATEQVRNSRKELTTCEVEITVTKSVPLYVTNVETKVEIYVVTDTENVVN